jgi:predicted restriction endonuclease
MTQNEIHNKFKEYLSQKVPESRCDEIINCVETELIEYIRKYFDNDFDSAYTQTDHNYYKQLRQGVFGNSHANEENNNRDKLFTEALRYYALFLDSKAFKGKEKVRLTTREKAEKKAKNQTKVQLPKNIEDPLLPPYNAEEELKEGQIRQVNITRHERNRALRQKCLEHYGYVCRVCGMNFEQQYGEIGKEFIEVHHLYPISNTDGEHEVDPITELVPLCCNCHSMIHRGGRNGEPMKLDELIQAYTQHHN